ncbi:MAG: hypothetical protein K9J16_09025 [Melioribacteraceae bacterium]|nr:hypothetical protein [Melioribacteraceae bacterium]MCF8353252.1 hypothetical protein [Melioribacteraceae bacterium]MCF8393984.1 hypothetical protein [Melioribacteraceae bacterium]MCF8418714.1 hypothetical protein [Melioribacteraceae bacterium]
MAKYLIFLNLQIVGPKGRFSNGKSGLILFVGLLLGYCTSKENDPIPQSFFGYTLDQKLTGEEAKNFVNRLHFNPVTDVKNEIGFYSSGRNKLLIYITYYENETIAKENELLMTKKISPESPVFSGGEYFELSSLEIYKCFGMGQNHYVFTHGNKLIWFQVDTEIGDSFLKSYLEYLN